MKIKITLIIFALIITLAFLYLSLLTGQKKQPVQKIEVAPTPSSQTFKAPLTSTPTLPPALQKEKIAEENYAKERRSFLQEKPWLLKLPLKSDAYFISYNPDTDTLLVTLYYLTDEPEEKESQLATATQDSLRAMTDAGIDTSTQKITYIETRKKRS